MITNQVNIVFLTQTLGPETNINLEEEKGMERKDDPNNATLSDLSAQSLCLIAY